MSSQYTWHSIHVHIRSSQPCEGAIIAPFSQMKIPKFREDTSFTPYHMWVLKAAADLSIGLTPS